MVSLDFTKSGVEDEASLFGATPGQGWYRWNACAQNDQTANETANGERHIGRASSL
jgi:hypothetical protein